MTNWQMPDVAMPSRIKAARIAAFRVGVRPSERGGSNTSRPCEPRDHYSTFTSGMSPSRMPNAASSTLIPQNSACNTYQVQVQDFGRWPERTAGRAEAHERRKSLAHSPQKNEP
jgi:hypothetical protein